MTVHWTPEAVRALGVRTDGVTACRLIYGVGETKARELLRRPEALDFKVIRVPGARTKYIVKVSELISLLGLDDAPTGRQAA